MSILNRPTQSHAVFILLAGVLFTLAPGGEAAVQGSGTKTVWHVQYVSGPISVIKGKKHKIGPLPSGASLNAKVGPEGIVFQKKKKVLLSVPSAGIDQVAYDRTSHRVSRAVVDQMEKDGQGCADYLCATAVMTELAVAAVALPFKYTNHYVTIAWRDKDEAHMMELKFAEHDYLPFLAELQKATNKPWRNLAEEKAAFRKAQKNSRKSGSQLGGASGRGN